MVNRRFGYKTLFSFERPEYERLVNNAVNTVYAMRMLDLERALKIAFYNFDKSIDLFIPSGFKLVRTEHDDYSTRLNLAQRKSGKNLKLNEHFTLALPDVKPMKSVLKDYDIFWNALDYGGVPSELEKPYFAENERVYRDLRTFFTHGNIKSESEEAGKHISESDIIRRLPSFGIFDNFREATFRLARHPMFYLSVGSANPEVSEILNNLESELLENGFPDQTYRRYVRETNVDAITLDAMNVKLAELKADGIIRRRINRKDAATYSMENYAVVQNGITMRDIVLTTEDIVREELNTMLPLFAPLEEILSQSAKDTDETFYFIRYVEKYWPESKVVSRLSTMENVEQVMEFFNELWEKHLTFNEGYKFSLQKHEKKIQDDFIRLWYYAGRRMIAERKLEDLEQRLKVKLRPRSDYTVFAVEDKNGQVLGYEYRKNISEQNPKERIASSDENLRAAWRVLTNFRLPQSKLSKFIS